MVNTSENAKWNTYSTNTGSIWNTVEYSRIPLAGATWHRSFLSDAAASASAVMGAPLVQPKSTQPSIEASINAVKHEEVDTSIAELFYGCNISPNVLASTRALWKKHIAT